jgi:NADPH2:quinone reductase
VPAVKALAPRGVDAVYDGVGKDTFVPSIDCVRPFGTLVNYGNASGPVPPIDVMVLGTKGSLTISRPGIHHYMADPVAYRAACAELFDLVQRGVLKVGSGGRYALKDAAQAHRDLEARRTVGSVVLLP